MKRRGIAPSRWRLARLCWEHDAGVSYAELGRRLRITRQAVYQHALCDGWERQVPGDDLLAQLADAGLGRRMPVSTVLPLADALCAMQQAIDGSLSHVRAEA